MSIQTELSDSAVPAGGEPGADINTLADALKKYGERMAPILRDYLDKMTVIGELNTRLAGLDADSDEGEYAEVAKDVVAATQDYYEFIGGLPSGLRQFFLSKLDKREYLAEFLDKEYKIDSAPLLTYRSIRPRNYIMQIDAITNQLANLGGQTTLNVGRRGSQPVLTTVALDMPDHMKIEGGGALSTYDKSILNGVTSLMESGNTVFSIPMLYHAMTGRQNPTVDEALYDEISGKLEKMRRMMLSIDLSEENKAHYVIGEDDLELEVTDVTLEGYLLPLNKVSGVVNGKRTELFQILQHPPLYTYSKMRRQLASVPISLLGAPVNNNSTTIPLRTYLLQRVEMMKNPRNSIVQNSILYESIYKELGALDASKTRKQRIRNYATTILDYFVEQKYISAYTEYKKGRTIAGVLLYFPA
jgi:hypothetical protein